MLLVLIFILPLVSSYGIWQQPSFTSPHQWDLDHDFGQHLFNSQLNFDPVDPIDLSDQKDAVKTKKDALDGDDAVVELGNDLTGTVGDLSEVDDAHVDALDVSDVSYELVNGVLCLKCSPGFGVETICDAHRPTTCRPCAPGANYTATADGWHFRPCQPCSRCGEGMFAEAACTATADTFCVSCDAQLSKFGVLKLMTHNEDYRRKCSEAASLLASADDALPQKMTPTSAEFEKYSQNIEKMYGKDAMVSLDGSTDQTTKTWQQPKNPAPLVAIDSINVALAQENPRAVGDHVEATGRLEIQLLPDHISGVKSPWHSGGMNKNIKKDGTKSASMHQKSSGSNSDHSSITKSPLFIVKFGKLLGTKSEEDFLHANDDFPGKSFESSYALPGYPDNAAEGVVYKPSSHSYPYEELVHPSIFSAFQLKHHRKLIAMFVISVCLLVLIFFVLNLLRKQSKLNKKRREVAFGADLTDFDTIIIKQCAQQLQKSESRSKKQKSGRFNAFHDREDDDQSDHSLNVLENPLLAYLHESHNGNVENSSDDIKKNPGKMDV